MPSNGHILDAHCPSFVLVHRPRVFGHCRPRGLLIKVQMSTIVSRPSDTSSHLLRADHEIEITVRSLVVEVSQRSNVLEEWPKGFDAVNFKGIQLGGSESFCSMIEGSSTHNACDYLIWSK